MYKSQKNITVTDQHCLLAYESSENLPTAKYQFHLFICLEILTPS